MRFYEKSTLETLVDVTKRAEDDERLAGIVEDLKYMHHFVPDKFFGMKSVQTKAEKGSAEFTKRVNTLKKVLDTLFKKEEILFTQLIRVMNRQGEFPEMRHLWENDAELRKARAIHLMSLCVLLEIRACISSRQHPGGSFFQKAP